MAINIKELKFQKYCKHCKYMKKYPGYTYRLFNSKYFDKQGMESLPDVMRAFKVPINQQTVYNCLKRHFPSYNNRAAVSVNNKGQTIVDARFAATETVLDTPTGTVKMHEAGLDEFIAEGRNMVKRGEIAITAANYITAIRVKADIEKSNKDRKLDLLKTMFSGAAPSEKTVET